MACVCVGEDELGDGAPLLTADDLHETETAASRSGSSGPVAAPTRTALARVVPLSIVLEAAFDAVLT
jgi:hypothetical protein